jgi:hypothetical protein
MEPARPKKATGAINMTVIDMRGRAHQPNRTERLETIIADYGAIRVIGAALLAMVRSQARRPRPYASERLPNSIRIDIGLPPVVDPPTFWNVRH